MQALEGAPGSKLSDAKHGPCKVVRLFGPPGTGKTTTMTRLIGEATSKWNGLVGVTSFTKTAALELRGRDLPISEHRVGTLHSLALRALGIPSDAILETNREALEAWNSDAPPRWELGGQRPIGAGAFEGVSESGEAMHRDQLRRQRLQPPSPGDAEDAQFYDRWKRESEVIDFTDMIELCLRREAPPPFDVAQWFHDETQDSTPLELALLRFWGSLCPGGLILAGDDQQAIYDFRGATPDAFLEGEAEERVLGVSWRLPETIRAFADEYGRQMQVYRPKDWRGQDREGEVCFDASCRLDNPWRVRDIILSELDGGSSTVMLLASCRPMLSSLLRKLREWGIPYENPYRPAEAAWNPLRTAGAGRLRTFLRSRAEDGVSCAAATRWIEMLDAKKVLARGAKAEWAKFCNEGGADMPFEWSIFRAAGGEELLPEEMPGIDWLEESVSSAKFLRQLHKPLEWVRAGGESVLADTPAVRVGTIHSVKGGEADSVILFPDISRAAWTQACSDETGWDAILRMFYVGMTRARRRLILGSRQRRSRYFERW